MTTLSLGNLAIYSMQVLLVVVAATIGATVVAPSLPRARLAFWRAVVVACLILPLWPTRRMDVPPTLSGTIAGERVKPAPGATEPLSTPKVVLIPWLLVVGAVGRGLWLTIGVRRLRRLRVRGVRATLGEDVESLQRVLAPHAELRWDERIDQPVTFGLRRPIVLLPRRLTDLPPAAQRAVVCHELVHVARHDWAWTLVEEVVQTAFWFHPAMWWALGEVQLSREETVDERVVALTGVRGPYMNALVMFAEARRTPAPTIASVRRRHLTSRIKRLSQEAVMSPARLAFVGATLVIVVVGSSLGVVSILPLHASTPGSSATQTGRATTGPQLKPALSGPRDFDIRDTSLTDVLAFIGMVNGIEITYESGLVDLPKVTVKVAQATVEDILNRVLTPNGLTYTVLDERSILVGRLVR